VRPIGLPCHEEAEAQIGRAGILTAYHASRKPGRWRKEINKEKAKPVSREAMLALHCSNMQKVRGARDNRGLRKGAWSESLRVETAGIEQHKAK